MKYSAILFLMILLAAFSVLAQSTIVPNRHNVPDFAASPTVTSVTSGNWFSGSTWSNGTVPTTDDIVLIDDAHTVTYGGFSTDSIKTIGIKGVLTFHNAINSELHVSTVQIYPGGEFEIGSVANPILSNTNVNITISNRPLGLMSDPDEWGSGIIAMGKLTVHGSEIPNTWFNLTTEPLAGDTTLTLDATPIAWEIGDTIILPGTKITPLIRLYGGQTVTKVPWELEELTISGINGKVITLTQPLVYDHLGGRDSDGNLLFLPHVANLSRNITIASENTSGVRGHIIAVDHAEVDFRYAAIVGMGRTTAEPLDSANLIGRYPIHLHHVMGAVNPTNTGYQFVVEGITVDDGEKWAISVHNAHYGLVKNNVFYDTTGAGIMTEEGNEHANEFIDNFVAKVGTQIASKYNPRYGGVTKASEPTNFGDFGWEGSCLWFTGNDNIVTGNIAANCSFAGLMYNARSKGFVPNNARIPKFRGADIDNPSHWTQSGVPAPSVMLSENNTVYGSTEGAWVGFAHTVGHISNLNMWAIKQTGLYSKRNASASYSNLTILSDKNVSNLHQRQNVSTCLDMENPVYHSSAISFTNINCQGFTLGADFPSFVQLPSVIDKYGKEVSLKDSTFQNFINLRFNSNRVNETKFVIDNVAFETNQGPSDKVISSIPANIIISMYTPWSGRNMLTLQEISILNFNQIPGNDYDIFYYEQEPGLIMPARYYPVGVLEPNQNCPTQGLTNQECFTTHGVATLGRPATCTTATSTPLVGVEAIACATGSSPPPPPVVVIRSVIDAVLAEIARMLEINGKTFPEAHNRIIDAVTDSQ